VTIKVIPGMTTNEKVSEFQSMLLNDGCNADASINVVIWIAKKTFLAYVDGHAKSIEAPSRNRIK
jgi:hypothetical protein